VNTFEPAPGVGPAQQSRPDLGLTS
jgi:hypothetical protein